MKTTHFVGRRGGEHWHIDNIYFLISFYYSSIITISFQHSAAEIWYNRQDRESRFCFIIFIIDRFELSSHYKTYWKLKQHCLAWKGWGFGHQSAILGICDYSAVIFAVNSSTGSHGTRVHWEAGSRGSVWQKLLFCLYIIMYIYIINTE